MQAGRTPAQRTNDAEVLQLLKKAAVKGQQQRSHPKPQASKGTRPSSIGKDAQGEATSCHESRSTTDSEDVSAPIAESCVEENSPAELYPFLSVSRY